MFHREEDFMHAKPTKIILISSKIVEVLTYYLSMLRHRVIVIYNSK